MKKFRAKTKNTHMPKEIVGYPFFFLGGGGGGAGFFWEAYFPGVVGKNKKREKLPPRYCFHVSLSKI